MAATDLTPEQEARFWAELRAQDAKQTQYRREAAVNPALAANLVAAHSAAPSAAPGVKLSVAQAAAAGLINQQQMIDAVMASMNANLSGAVDALRASKQKPWLQRVGHDPISEGLYGGIKGIVRTGLGVAQSGAQLMQSNLIKNSPSQATERVLREAQTKKIDPAADPLTVLKSTTAGQQVSNLVSSGTTDQGSGWFPSGAAEVYRRDAERQVRGVIPGTNQTATPGRVLASSVFEPGSSGYRLLSGAADAGVSWYLDPANAVMKGYKTAKEGRNLITAAKGLADADLARVLRPGEKIVEDSARGRGVWRNALNKPEFVPYADVATEARTLRQAEAGVIDAHRGTFSARKAEEWTQTRQGQQVIQSIADDSDFLSIHNALGRKVAPEVVARLTDAKTPQAVRETLLDVLGTSIRSTTDIKKVKAPHWWQQTRAWQKMPAGKLETGYRTTTAERIHAVDNLDAYLANAKVPWAERSSIVKDFAVGLTTHAQDRYEAMRSGFKAVERSMLAYGTDAGWAKDLTSLREAEVVRKYGVNRLAQPDDWGFLEKLQDGGYGFGDVHDVLKAAGPMLLSEGLGDTTFLPNIREIRRLTSRMGWITGTKQGKLRGPLAAVEWFQNDVIKPLAIIRPAFVMRVVGEEQFRMAAAQQASAVRHPLEWIMFAMHKSGSYDALGNDFHALATKASDATEWDEYSAALHRGLNQRNAKHLIDPLAAERQSYLTGSWSDVSKHADPQQWEQGLTDELRQLSRDPIAARVAGGETTDDIMKWLRSSDEEAKRVYPELKARGERMPAFLPNGKRVWKSVDYADDNVLRGHIDDYIRGRIAEKAAQNPDLLGAIAHGGIGTDEVTLADKALTVVRDGAGPNVVDPFTGKASTWIGSRVKLEDGRIGVIANNADEAGKSIVAVGGRAWDHTGKASDQMVAAAREWRLHDASPDSVKYAVRTTDRLAGGRGEIRQQMIAMKDKAIDSFFSGFYGRTSDYLSRSPAFRQFYWQRASELADNLSPDEASKFLHAMEEAATRHEGGKVAALLGGDKAVGRVIEAAKRADGTVTHAQLDDYARGWALDKTKSLLYDASKRGQFFDIARVIFPFGEAWKEVAGAWAKMIVHDPRLARRGQLIVEGGRDLDPDGNGTGFFHVDPATGNEVFTIPFSAEASRALTGMVGPVPIGQDMNISLKSLNIGLTATPGIGWVASAAVGTFLPDKPQFDEIRSFLLPYGDKGLTGAAVTPSWLTKIVGGLTDSPNSTRIYGDTYMRTVQLLLASGEYGTSHDEQERLKKDATRQARVLTIIRGLQQAVGPASPSVDFKVATENGDAMASALSKEYASLVQENPQTALETFQRIYGLTATAYAVSRTRSVNGGLDASKQFGDWERSHRAVFSQAPDVAGYFGPVGTDFDFAIYERQLRSGARVKLSADEYLSAVNEVIGNAKYYDLRDQMNAANAAVDRKSPTTEQRAWLKRQREKILAEYPVPNPAANDRAPLPDQIRQLSEVIDSKGLKGNPVAEATRQYLTLRDQAMQSASAAGFTLAAGDAQPLREWLARKGAKLAVQTPEFARLWDRVLAREVEGV